MEMVIQYNHIRSYYRYFEKHKPNLNLLNVPT